MNYPFNMKFLTIPLILACLAGTLPLQSQNKITAVKIGSRIDISINDNLFTQYVFSEDEKYPYFFPVNGPSGFSLTSMRNGLYPHHSSLFFACDRLNGGNYWQEGLERGQIKSLRAEILKSGKDSVVIENECIWWRPGAESPVRDLRRITVTTPSRDLYQIDFDIRMDFLADVTIEKTNHSLFSVRMAPALSAANGGKMINAGGDSGEQGDTGTFGKSSPWMDGYGTINGKTEGLAIFQHPSNPWYPSPWFTRDYGFFSPTPMYFPKDEKEGTRFKKGQSLQLRYRVLVHSGDPVAAGVGGKFEEYGRER
jgi:hypothetical protein